MISPLNWRGGMCVVLGVSESDESEDMRAEEELAGRRWVPRRPCKVTRMC